MRLTKIIIIFFFSSITSNNCFSQTQPTPKDTSNIQLTKFLNKARKDILTAEVIKKKSKKDPVTSSLLSYETKSILVAAKND